MSLSSSYNNTGNGGGESRWLAREINISEGQRFVVKLGNVRNVETRFNGPGWACYADDPEGRSIKIENPWVRTKQDGSAVELHFLFLGLLRAARKAKSNNLLPPPSEWAEDPDATHPVLLEGKARDLVAGCWVTVKADRVRRVGEAQYVDWSVVGPAVAPMADEGAPDYGDDDIPF